MSPPEIANAISDALLDSLQSYKPMDCDPTVTLLPLEENPDFLEVSVQRVYNNLKHLNKQKASGPDGLLNWVSKEYVEVLAQPVCDTSNTLYKEQKLPSVWKLADVTPLPKVKRVIDPKKLLRSISLTPSALSKIAEDLLSQTLWNQLWKRWSTPSSSAHRIRTFYSSYAYKYVARMARGNRRKWSSYTSPSFQLPKGFWSDRSRHPSSEVETTWYP